MIKSTLFFMSVMSVPGGSAVTSPWQRSADLLIRRFVCCVVCREVSFRLPLQQDES